MLNWGENKEIEKKEDAKLFGPLKIEGNKVSPSFEE
jgi:hypothetical protein